MKSRLARTATVLAALAVTVLVIFPLLFGPGVEDPSTRFPDNPFSLEVKISNENLTPLTNLEYYCEPVQIELANGVKIPDVKVVNQGRITRFRGRKAITVRCETAYIIDAPIKNAEFKLALKYRTYPWPSDRTSEYRFAAVVDASGHVTKWVRK